jgi:hypothetical protein
MKGVEGIITIKHNDLQSQQLSHRMRKNGMGVGNLA